VTRWKSNSGRAYPSLLISYTLRFILLLLPKVPLDRLLVHLAIVEPDPGLLFSSFPRKPYMIIRARRDFYERCLKIRRAPFRWHKEPRCSPRTKELSYVSRKTFSLYHEVCVCVCVCVCARVFQGSNFFVSFLKHRQ